MTARATKALSREVFDLLYDLFGQLKPHFEEAAATVALSPPAARALRLLDTPMPMRDLAIALTCDASYVTAIIDHLETDGLVERQVSATDRRVKEIRITRPGREVRRKLEARLFDRMPGAHGMTDDELAELRDGLSRMVLATRQG